MIPPLNIEYPKIVDNTIYRIAGGTIIKEDISLTAEGIRKQLELYDVKNS